MNNLENYDVELLENKLILSPTIISLLNAQVGDRIEIEYIEKDGVIIPIIIKSQAGNKLTKSNTVSFRGKANVDLASYGTKFKAELIDSIICLYGNNPEYKIYNGVQSALKNIDKSIIENTNFNININSFTL